MDTELIAIAARGNIVLRNERDRAPFRDWWAESGVRQNLQLIEVQSSGVVGVWDGTPQDLMARLASQGIVRLDYWAGTGTESPMKIRPPMTAVFATGEKVLPHQPGSMMMWSFDVSGERFYRSDGRLQSVRPLVPITVPCIEIPTVESACESIARSIEATASLAERLQAIHAMKWLRRAQHVLDGGLRAMWLMMSDSDSWLLPADGYGRRARQLAMAATFCGRSGICDERNWDCHASDQLGVEDFETISGLRSACDHAFSAGIGSFFSS